MTFKHIFAERYDSTCPLKEIYTAERDYSPWFCSAIRQAITDRRRAERIWRKFRTDASFALYKVKRNRAVNLIKRKKAEYYRNAVDKASGDPRQLYSTLNNLLGKKKEMALPDTDDRNKLREDFADSFQEKIDSFQSCFNQDTHSFQEEPIRLNSILCDLDPLSMDDLNVIIKNRKKNFK